MLTLPLDIRIEIASYFDTVWVQMALADNELRKYTLNNIRKFTDLFTVEDVYPNYTTYKLLNRLHRINDLPAVICDSSDMFWYQNNKLYRENGNYTAFEDHDMKWYIPSDPHYKHMYILSHYWDHDGQLHRENDLPAVIEEYTDDDGKKIIDYQEWWLNGKEHRDNDLPAWQSEQCSRWYKHGKPHREVINGEVLPAIIYHNANYLLQEYWRDGVRYYP